MNKSKATIVNQWFESVRSSSFALLLFSFIPSINIAFLFGAYDSFKGSQDSEILLFIFQGIIGLAFGITFFAPLWAKIPIATENDFLFFRYSGKFVSTLKNTRSILLGVFVIPLLMSIVIKTPLELLNRFQISNQWIYLIVFAILLIYGVKNSINHRINFDFSVGIILVLICLIAIIVLSSSTKLDSLKIPISTHTISKSNILLAGFITWWFANIVDLPDMRAQKLLSASSTKSGYFSFLIGNGLIMILQGVFICVYALFRFDSHPIVDFICISALIISSFVQLMNLQHWSGSLMHGFFKNSISNQRIRNYTPMAISIGIAHLICLLTNNVFEIIQGILFFSAGVGPVYILRWTYYRINALTQLTAMLSSLFLGIIYISLNASSFLDFSQLTFLNLSPTNTAICVLGLINCLIWGSVMLISQNDEENDLSKKRLQEIHSESRKNLFLKIGQFIITSIFLLLLFAAPYLLFVGV